MLALVSLSLLGLKANSWQARLDKALLSVDMELKERFRNLQRDQGPGVSCRLIEGGRGDPREGLWKGTS